jgi:hypothetical protein
LCKPNRNDSDDESESATVHVAPHCVPSWSLNYAGRAMLRAFLALRIHALTLS